MDPAPDYDSPIAEAEMRRMFPALTGGHGLIVIGERMYGKDGKLWFLLRDYEATQKGN